MVNPAINQTIPDRTIPYLTRDQYRCEPTSQDTTNLIRGGGQADQDAELDRLILKASGWCDNAAEQPLTAQVTTETMRARVAPGGILRLHPRQHPIVQVNGVTFGPDASSMSTLNDLSGVWVEDQSIEVPLQAAIGSGGFTGPLQFGTARPGSRVRVALTYVAGYPVSTLPGTASSGATTVTLADATGFIPGTQIRLTQGGSPSGQGSAQQSLTQAVAVVQSVAGNTLTLAAPLTASFTAGAGVSALPEELEQACILVVTALLKQRGSGALVMSGGRATVKKDDGGWPGAEEFAEAEAILALYRPVAP